MAEEAKEKLIELEVVLDQRARELPVINQRSVRALFAAFHVLINGQLNRDQDDPMAAGERGVAAAARLSYLVRDLIENMAIEPLGADGTDALEGYHEVDSDGSQLRFLLTYGHFSEVMPEMHRGYFAVSGDRDSGFTLRHASPAFAEHEVRDIMLTEFGGPFGFAVAPAAIDEEFDALVATAPVLPADGLIAMHERLYGFYLKALTEPALLTDPGMVAATGATNDEFDRFRAAVYAVGDFCRGIARALGRRVEAGGAGEEVEKEWLEWITVNWKADFVIGVLRQLSGLDVAQVEKLLDIYTLDLRCGVKKTAHAGDGYLPPFLRLSESFIFNGDLIRLFLLARNVLFVVNRLDKKLFDDLVSKEMEPQLIEQAVALLARLPGVEIVRTHDWGAGEIDILVYSAEENVALHVQAKAAIPPQGARMVAAVESRGREGLEQLKRFRELAPERRDEVISTAIGRDVAGVDVVDVLLSRTSFGTSNIWRQAQGVALVNLLLLGELVVRDPSAPLAEFARRADVRLDEIIALARPEWIEREIDLDLAKLRLPILDYELESLAHARADAWRTVGPLL